MAKQCRLQNIKFVFMACCLTACSTSGLNVSSSPQNAKVSLVGNSLDEEILLGQTPLTLNSRDIAKLKRKSGPLMLAIEKPGYRNENILVTEFSQIDLKIHQNLKPIDSLDDFQKINSAIDHLFEAQRLTRQNRFENALKQLDLVSAEFPQIAATYEIRGGIHYLQKKYQEALEDFDHLISMTPNNAEAHSMQVRLRGVLGIKLDAESKKP
jgi:tetratricopeptide (TPR) repeat protein